jgi:predicted DNA-binding protein (MmcQ/YjbR family)
LPRKRNQVDQALKELRDFGLAYPGAHLKSPWPGHLDLAVKDKTFAYLSVEGEPFGISCKLPRSNVAALMQPYTTPTGYGLGKIGWVSAQYPAGEVPPVEVFKAWIDESYRAQAPKKLVAALPPPGQQPPPATDRLGQDRPTRGGHERRRSAKAGGGPRRTERARS